MLAIRLVVEKDLANSIVRLREMLETNEKVAMAIVEVVVAF